jgi:5-methylcytosine-specific restriction endonuclease McrA
MGAVMDRPVLVLNASYEPLRFAAARDAIKLICKAVALAEVEHDQEIHRGIKLPSVVRLIEFRKVPHIRTRPSARNIFLRDDYQCQYCGEHFHVRDLTLDHVTPRAQGGPDTWENLVTACKSCNGKKADRTPEEAGMVLLNRPRPATIHTSRHLMRKIGHRDPAWRQFLYY